MKTRSGPPVASAIGVRGALPATTGAGRGEETAVATASALDARAVAHLEAHDLIAHAPHERIRAIMMRAGERHGVTREDILARGRAPAVIAARHDAINTVARVFPKMT